MRRPSRPVRCWRDSTGPGLSSLINSATIAINGKQSSPAEDMPNRAAVIERLRDLHGEHPDYPVLIAGDRDSKYDDVIQLISEAKKMGINRVGLATK